MPAREVVRRPCLGPRGRRPPQPGEEAGQQRQGNHRIRAAPVRRQHVACRRVFPARQRLAINQRDHDLRSIQQPLVEVALAEARHDRLVDDACGIGIGNRTFQAIAGLEAHAAVLHGHQQQHAIIDTGAAQLPLLEHPLCSACVRSALRVSADSAWAVSTTGSSSAGTATAAIAIIGNRHSSNSPTVAQVRLTARSPLMRPAPARSAHAMPAAVRPTG
ncbi:hypothetical protein G6F35_015133 [Rhizopus arrhizus]|nr:hypothetical protein G6F35_015133 [Rhizopus arrhizus]